MNILILILGLAVTVRPAIAPRAPIVAPRTAPVTRIVPATRVIQSVPRINTVHYVPVQPMFPWWWWIAINNNHNAAAIIAERNATAPKATTDDKWYIFPIALIGVSLAGAALLLLMKHKSV